MPKWNKVALLLTDGRLGKDESERRLKAVLRLLGERTIDGVLISGGLPDKKGWTLAETYAAWLKLYGVSEDKIRLETKSRDTAENIIFCTPVLHQIDPQEVILLSNRQHLRRTGLMIRACKDWLWKYSTHPTSPPPGIVNAALEWAFFIYTLLDPLWQSWLAQWARERRQRHWQEGGYSLLLVNVNTDSVVFDKSQVDQALELLRQGAIDRILITAEN